tara:strand:+ start:2528 stop:2755 length:228 start_codon:yes stop_codon:yes gene_type:complete
MKFNQYEDGSCDILFSKEETEIISKKQKLHLSDVFLRHFGNNLVKVVADWNIKFSEEVQNQETKEDMEIETSEKD